MCFVDKKKVTLMAEIWNDGDKPQLSEIKFKRTILREED